MTETLKKKIFDAIEGQINDSSFELALAFNTGDKKIQAIEHANCVVLAELYDSIKDIFEEEEEEK